MDILSQTYGNLANLRFTPRKSKPFGLVQIKDPRGLKFAIPRYDP